MKEPEKNGLWEALRWALLVLCAYGMMGTAMCTFTLWLGPLAIKAGKVAEMIAIILMLVLGIAAGSLAGWFCDRILQRMGWDDDDAIGWRDEKPQGVGIRWWPAVFAALIMWLAIFVEIVFVKSLDGVLAVAAAGLILLAWLAMAIMSLVWVINVVDALLNRLG